MNDNQDLIQRQFILRPDDDKSWPRAMEYLTKHESENLELTVVRLGKVRTLTQNSSIHKYCSMLAVALNEAGHYRRKKLFGNHVELPWTMNSIKEDVWHVVQFAMFPHAINEKGEPASSKLNTVEVGEVYKVISCHMAIKGVDVPWPSNRG